MASDGTNGETTDSSSTDRNRLQEAEEELSVLRDALQRAEQRAESRAWNVPVELELHLRKTYSVELSYFKNKRAAAEKQLQTAKEHYEKLYKKQQTLFGPFRVAHGFQLDTVDDGLVAAKAALMELAADMTERSARWSRIEILTGLNIVSPNANSDGVYLRRHLSQGHFASPSFTAESGASLARRRARFSHPGSTSDLTEHSYTTTSTSKNGNGPRGEQYDPFRKCVSWDADNLSLDSDNSMPLTINETKRSQLEEQKSPQGNGLTRSPPPMNRTELSTPSPPPLNRTELSTPSPPLMDRTEPSMGRLTSRNRTKLPMSRSTSLNRIKLSSGGLSRREIVHFDSTVTVAKIHSDSAAGNGHVGVSTDEEERATRKVSTARSDVGVSSMFSLDMASQYGEGFKTKKSSLKKLFGK